MVDLVWDIRYKEGFDLFKKLTLRLYVFSFFPSLQSFISSIFMLFFNSFVRYTPICFTPISIQPFYAVQTHMHSHGVEGVSEMCRQREPFFFAFCILTAKCFLKCWCCNQSDSIDVSCHLLPSYLPSHWLLSFPRIGLIYKDEVGKEDSLGQPHWWWRTRISKAQLNGLLGEQHFPLESSEKPLVSLTATGGPSKQILHPEELCLILKDQEKKAGQWNI